MSSGLNAYKQTLKSTLSGRELEASVLIKGAQLLQSCQEHWRDESHFSRLDEALIFNQRIWAIFQNELIKKDNPLPEKLRADILSLSVFIDKRIVDVMSEPVSEKLDIIININLNLAAGLRGSAASD